MIKICKITGWVGSYPACPKSNSIAAGVVASSPTILAAHCTAT